MMMQKQENILILNGKHQLVAVTYIIIDVHI